MAQSNVGEFVTGSGVSQSESRTFVTYSENLLFAGYSTLNYGFSRYGDSINFLITTDIITVTVLRDDNSFEGGKVYCVNQTTNDVYTATTDVNGVANVSVESGDYHVFARGNDDATVLVSEKTFYNVTSEEDV